MSGSAKKAPQTIPELSEHMDRRFDRLEKAHEDVMDKFGIVISMIHENRQAIERNTHRIERLETKIEEIPA